MKSRFGEQFIHQQNPELHTAQPVEHEKRRLERRGEEISDKPADKLADWLNILEQTHTGHQEDPKVLDRLKKYYYKRHVIKQENIPDSYWDLQRKIITNEGRSGDFEKDEAGKIIIPDEIKEQAEATLISDQEKSLDKWLDYLTSTDAEYPMWAKYWAFTSMVKMGKLEKKEDETGKETARFQKRTKDTVAPFPTLNPRALAETISVIEAWAREKQKAKQDRVKTDNKSAKLSDEEFKQLLSTENFAKIYSQFLIEMPEYSAEGLKNIEGKWVKYDQGSTPDKLVQSLEGHPLEWCTANIDTARTQLEGGDFYVYYSYGKDDDKDNPTIPRIAIRMEGQDKIAEVRGIAADQNFDPYIAPVIDAKLKEFGSEGNRYQKSSADMKQLTVIGNKIEKDQKLTRDDLIFLYEINSSIQGFGYGKDLRIKELQGQRDILEDIRTIYDFDNPNKEALEFIYNVGKQPTPKVFLTVTEALRQNRNLENDMLIIFECEPNQIIHNQTELKQAIKDKKEIKAYVGELFPGIFNLLPNTLEYIYTEFPRYRIRQKTIELGTGLKTKEDFEKAITNQGGRIGRWVKDIMSKPEFEISEEKSNEDLVILFVKDLGFPNVPTVKEIFERAKELGLELCSPETGPQLRLQYLEQPNDELCLIGMSPISNSDGDPLLFEVCRSAGRMSLETENGGPDSKCWALYRFAFRRASKS